MKSHHDACIYCGETDQTLFTGREHVLPRAFGTYGSTTPTLNCVCDPCNAYFSQHLDRILARETIEGVTRYNQNLLSKEKRSQKRLRFELADEKECGEFSGAVIEGVDPTTGELLPLRAQLQIRNRRTGKMDVYFREHLHSITLPDDVYGKPGTRETKIFGPTKAEHDAFLEDLQKAGIPIRQGEPFAPAPFMQVPGPLPPKILVHIEGEIDDLHKRALAKILVNFAAHNLGYAEVQKSAWMPIKRYVRYGEGVLAMRLSSQPFWTGQETKDMRFASDSINIRIENNQRGLVGAIQFYNRLAYELLLIEEYAIDPRREVACRFTPGTKPLFGQRAPPDRGSTSRSPRRSI